MIGPKKFNFKTFAWVILAAVLFVSGGLWSSQSTESANSIQDEWQLNFQKKLASNAKPLTKIENICNLLDIYLSKTSPP